MKIINELLKLLLYEVKTGNLQTGLCSITQTLVFNNVISREEKTILRRYIYHNRPNPNSITIKGYYWIPCQSQPRIKWLNKHIKLTQHK